MTALRTLMVGFGEIASGLDQDLRMARYFKYASHASVLSVHPAFDWLGTVDLREEALIGARDKWQVPIIETDLAAAIEKVRTAGRGSCSDAGPEGRACRKAAKRPQRQ